MAAYPVQQTSFEQANGRLLENNDVRQDGVRIVRRQRRWCTKTETILGAALLLVLICAVVLTVVCLNTTSPEVCLNKTSSEVRIEDQVCTTKHCVLTSAALLASIDPLVDPCDDFYMYACGNWIRTHPIPDDRASISNFEQRQIELEYGLRQIFESTNPENSSTFEKAKQLYRLCANDSQVATTWESTFNDFVQQLGGWPIRGDPFDPNISLERIYATLIAHHSEESLFKFSVGPDDKNAEQNVLQIDQAHLMLGVKDVYELSEGAEELAAYFNLMIKTMVLLNVSDATARTIMREVLDFERDLARITVFDETRMNTAFLYWKLPVGKLGAHFPNFNWRIFLAALFPGRTVVDSTPVVVYCKSFLHGFNRLIGSKPRRVILNYLIWRWFSRSVLPYLPAPWGTAYYEFQLALGQLQAPQLRWHGCVKQVNNLLQDAAGAMYIREHFDEKSKKHASEMIRMLMDSFEELLHENDWLTANASLLAGEKARSMSLKIAYPDYFLNLTYLDTFHEDYNVSPDDFYRTKFTFESLNNRHALDQLGKPVHKTKWETAVAVVNAFYNPNANEITLPAAILLPVFFSDTYPWSMNFGGIGVVIGHEITHGFDDKGRHYDKSGNIIEWWDNETVQSFEERASCIENQYKMYHLEMKDGRIPINGKTTKGENIADNGGLKQAFRAYKNYVKKHGREPKLPGLNFTHEQLFFLNYAQIWCGSANFKEAVRKVRSGVHSPGPIRVRGPLSNLNDFASAFDCPVGSNMNPPAEEKCKVW